MVFVNHCQFIQSPFILRFLKTPSVYYCQEPRRVSYEYNFKIKHNSNIKSIIGNYLLSKEDEINARSANIILANSYFSMESIYKSYGLESKVCYLGIDSSKFKSLDGHKINKNRKVVSVGALDPAKGFEFIIKSIALVPTEIRPKLIIISDRWDPSYKEYILKLARQLFVNVRTLRRVSDHKLIDIYRSSRLTLCGAHLEPFGFTALESMSCKTPVIAVKEAGFRETVTKGGILVDRDKQKFAEAIVDVSENYELLNRLGEEGESYVREKWTWELSVKNLETFLQKASANGNN